MSHGIEVRDAAGNIIFDSTWRLGRILGSVQSGTAAGSVNVTANYGNGSLFAFAVDISTPAQVSSGCPAVYVSGNTVSWNWPAKDGLGFRKNSLIMWGVF